MVASGHVKPILVFKTERINTPELKDVPCSGELGFAGLENLGTWRGFAVKKGTPQEAIDVLEAALKRVYDSAEYQKWAKENVLDITPGWLDAAGYRALWDNNLKSYTEVFTKLGRL